MYNDGPKKKFKKLARQGDVLMERVKSKGKLQARPEEQPGKVILAHGEVTGHHHRFEGPGAELFVDADESVFVKVDGMNFLRHEEHFPILPSEGTFEVVIQQEYEYGTTQNVAD